MSTETLSNNKQIAKNSLMMYLRTFFVMVVGFYTSRVILATLGAEDFGIYNIVGGVVVLFTFLESVLKGAIQRFLTFYIGKDDKQKLDESFAVSLSIITIASLLLFVIGEVACDWAINSLNIPEGRATAAFWIYQFSLLTTCANMLRVPYEASIVAHEKFSFYAYLGIVEALFKLIIVYLLLVINHDKLISYGVLVFIVSLVINLLFYLNKNKYYPTSIKKFIFSWGKVKEILGFTGWSFWGGSTSLFALQGINVVFNIYYGVLLNAALGIANQVNNYMFTFTRGFFNAYTPQIVKLYAKEEYSKLYKLIGDASKFGYLLFFLPSAIFLLNSDYLLQLWLGNIPEYTVAMTNIVLLCTLIDSLTAPYYEAIQATGNIKWYQISISIVFALDVVITIFLASIGIKANFILFSRLATRGLINMVIGWFFLKRRIQFPLWNYIIKTVVPVLIYSVAIFAFTEILIHSTDGLTRLLLSTSIFLPIALFSVYGFLLKKEERQKVLQIVKNKIHRF